LLLGPNLSLLPKAQGEALTFPLRFGYIEQSSIIGFAIKSRALVSVTNFID
jgi:hypothetical protein